MEIDNLQLHKAYPLSYNLQFFAEGGDKTEEPTTKKLSDARKEGQVARSNELVNASSLVALFLVLKIFLGFIVDRFLEVFNNTYMQIDKIAREDISTTIIQSIISDSIIKIIWICIPVFLTAMVISFVVNVVQVKWQVSGKLLQPKLNKLDPISGFRKIFSKDKIVSLILEVIKIYVIYSITYDALKEEWRTLLILYDIDLIQAVALTGTIVTDLGLKISFIFLIIGLADLIYQKFKFKKDMRMTKQEIKDEFKQMEGDPQIKSRIRRKMREVSQKRMMQALPQADVIITNPTHLAVAIKYDKETSSAPVVIAKGADYLAQKIKEVAKENNIEIVENKPLARMLYYNVELGAEIPPELYQMTAEVLAYVYGLKK
ncbi:MAG: flagellar biosynthesis protein FlhB [Clostridiales bacterium]|nr:flagellar biosynthesis protein FlhB [Clostridiales bacterium]